MGQVTHSSASPCSSPGGSGQHAQTPSWHGRMHSAPCCSHNAPPLNATPSRHPCIPAELRLLDGGLPPQELQPYLEDLQFHLVSCISKGPSQTVARELLHTRHLSNALVQAHIWGELTGPRECRDCAIEGSSGGGWLHGCTLALLPPPACPSACLLGACLNMHIMLPACLTPLCTCYVPQSPAQAY